MTPSRTAHFAELLQRHRGIVLKVAGSYCRNPDDRAELAQEIAAQLWRAYPRYDPARSFSTWMYRIALNVAISHVRADGPRHRHTVALDESLHDTADVHSPGPEAARNVDALHRFIRQLEPLNRALMLLYLEDRSQREIAEVLGLSETNVSTKINRLKQRIRDEL